MTRTAICKGGRRPSCQKASVPALFKRRLREAFGDAYADAAEKGDTEGMKRHYFDTYKPAGARKEP